MMIMLLFHYGNQKQTPSGEDNQSPHLPLFDNKYKLHKSDHCKSATSFCIFGRHLFTPALFSAYHRKCINYCLTLVCVQLIMHHTASGLERLWLMINFENRNYVNSFQH